MDVYSPLGHFEYDGEAERGPLGTFFNGVVGQQDAEEGDPRWYIRPADEEAFVSVTTAQGASTDKMFLREWHSKSAAVFAVQHIEEVARKLAEEGEEATVKWVKGEAKRIRDLKRDIGTHQHDILEALILDQPIPDCPEHLVGIEIDGEAVDQDAISDGLLNFFEDHRPIVEMAESTVANTEHGYAGTLDLGAWFPNIRIRPNMPKGARICLDLKTGKTPGDEAPSQIVAYKSTDEVWLPLGETAETPRFDLCGILHLRREYRRGYKLKLVDPLDERFYFEEFLTCLRRFRFLEEKKSKVMIPFYSPQLDGSQPLPLLEDIEGDGFGRCRKKLSEAGLDDVGDLASMTEYDVLQLKGIGPKAIEACNEVMKRYGLTFAAKNEEVA